MSKKAHTIAAKSLRPIAAPKVLRSAPRRPAPEQVARRAFEIYLDEGRPDGRHLEHWARAETELTR